MIHGATARRERAIRMSVEAMTRTPTHAHPGSSASRARRPLAAKARFAQRLAELGGLGRAGGDPDFGGGVCDLTREGVLNRGAPGGLLDRGGVEGRYAVEPVLALDVRERRGACLRKQAGIGERLQRRR